MDRSIQALAIIVIGAVLATPVACTMNRQTLVAEAIKHGADPIATRCAIEWSGSSSNNQDLMCIVKAMEKK